MKNHTFFIMLWVLSILIVFSDLSFSQSTTIKLATPDSASSFNITKSDSTPIFKLFGDGGFYIGGTLNSGSIPITGAGTRLMWYPGKAAFRAGSVLLTQWDYANIGNYSTAMGLNTTASGSSSTAMGSNTNASGFHSTAMGVGTTASATASTAMGTNTTASGFHSTAMGQFTTASGAQSTAMGSYVSTNLQQGSFIIGDNSTFTVLNSTAPNQMKMRFNGGYELFTKSDLSIGVLLGSGGSSWSGFSDSTRKENFVNADGEYFLTSLSMLRLGSWNYKLQDPKKFRHYGPMAQEIFHYFGKDKLGTIGNDTTLATQDMDGIMMICLQALNERTKKDSENITKMKEKISSLKVKLLVQGNAIEELKDELLEMKEMVNNFEKDSESFSEAKATDSSLRSE